MKTHLLKSILLVTIVVLLAACTEDNAKLSGKWERFDDEAAGTVVNVNKSGTQFQGKLAHVSGALTDLGFEKDDLKWKNIKLKEKNYFTAQDLEKSVNKNNEVARKQYVDVFIELISDDILYLSTSEKGSNNDNENRQKWRRVSK